MISWWYHDKTAERKQMQWVDRELRMSKDVLYKKRSAARICRVRVRIVGRFVVLGHEVFLLVRTHVRSPIPVPLDEPRWIDTTKSLYRRGPQSGPRSSRTYRHGSRQKRRSGRRFPVFGSKFWHLYFFVDIEERRKRRAKAEGVTPDTKRTFLASATYMAFIYKPHDCHSVPFTPYLGAGWFVGAML